MTGEDGSQGSTHPETGTTQAHQAEGEEAGGPELEPNGTRQAEAIAKRLRTRAIIVKVVFWLLFSVILGLLPVIAGAIVSFLRKNNIDFVELLANGEVLILSAAISGGALGELIFAGKSSNKRDENRQDSSSWGVLAYVTLGFFSILFCLCNAIAYAVVKESPNTTVVAAISAIFFVLTLIVSAMCIGVAAAERISAASAGDGTDN